MRVLNDTRDKRGWGSLILACLLLILLILLAASYSTRLKEWQIVNNELQGSLLSPTAPNALEEILGHPPYILIVERPFGVKDDGEYIYSCIFARVNYLTQSDIGRPVEYKLFIEHNLSENKVKVTKLDFGASKLVRTPCVVY